MNKTGLIIGYSTVSSFPVILNEIKQIVKKARYASYMAVNYEMLRAYFEIGKRIVEEEQKGQKRAGYGEKLLERLSKELNKEFGKGFSSTALRNMRLFYKIYKNKIHQSLADEFFRLSWTLYCELIKIEDETKRRYFEKYSSNENLSIRDLKRQIYSLHYERLLMSKDKKALIEHERKKNVPNKPEELIKEPSSLNFWILMKKANIANRSLKEKCLITCKSSCLN